MRLPQVQAALRAVARQLAGSTFSGRLYYLAREISRRKAKLHKPRVKTIRLSAGEQNWVKHQRRVAKLTYDEIEIAFEKKFGRLTNLGRISECLRGKRT